MKYRWVFNFLVVALVSYFLWSSVENVWKSRSAPNAVSEPERIKLTTEPASTVRPLEAYNIIAERNLFGSFKAEDKTPKEEESLEGIPVAVNDLNLKLVGTVVADEPEMNLAIITNIGTHEQQSYREGDRIGEVLVKKIVRENVIISRGRGDELLTIQYEEDGSTPRTTKTQNRRRVEKTPFGRGLPGSGRIPSKKMSEREPMLRRVPGGPVRLKRAEVESSFADINKLMEEVSISPYVVENQPRGFQIDSIKPGNVFSKMGLRNGDVIKSVNDEAITSPEEAQKFYHSLTEGGEISVEIQRGGRTSKLRLLVE